MLDPELIKLMNDLPKQWVDTKSLSMSAKEKMINLQKDEQNKLNAKIKDFQLAVNDYRMNFKIEAPYEYKRYSVEEAFQNIDKAREKLVQFRFRATELIASQGLFD